MLTFLFQSFAVFGKVPSDLKDSSWPHRFLQASKVPPGLKGSSWPHRFLLASKLSPGLKGSSRSQRVFKVLKAPPGLKGSSRHHRFLQASQVPPGLKGSSRPPPLLSTLVELRRLLIVCFSGLNVLLVTVFPGAASDGISEMFQGEGGQDRRTGRTFPR